MIANYVFVMLAPGNPGRDVQHLPEIGNAYRRSWLYRNDGSNTPLWTVDWYAHEVLPSSDGKPLVRIASLAS